MRTLNRIWRILQVVVVVYLAFAFISWEPNPKHWSQGVRVAYSLIAGGYILMVYLWNVIVRMDSSNSEDSIW